MNLIEQVLRTREAGRVKRCHTTTHIGEYNVATHTYNLLMLVDILAPEGMKPVLTKWALWHDVPEVYTGDAPAGLRCFSPEARAGIKAAEAEVCKKYSLPIPELSEEEKRWARALDQLEFLLWVEDQLAMGNRHVSKCHDAMKHWFMKEGDVPKDVFKFYLDYNWDVTSYWSK